METKNQYSSGGSELTMEMLTDMLKEIKGRPRQKFVTSTGIGGCENFVDHYGTAIFIMAVNDGSLIPAGEEAMEYYKKCMSGEIYKPGVPYPATQPFDERNILRSDPKITLTKGVKRGNKFTQKKKKRK